MNSVTGCVVYIAGEVTSELNNCELTDVNWRKVGGLGVLGMLENGVLMLGW